MCYDNPKLLKLLLVSFGPVMMGLLVAFLKFPINHILHNQLQNILENTSWVADIWLKHKKLGTYTR